MEDKTMPRNNLHTHRAPPLVVLFPHIIYAQQKDSLNNKFRERRPVSVRRKSDIPNSGDRRGAVHEAPIRLGCGPG